MNTKYKNNFNFYKNLIKFNSMQLKIKTQIKNVTNLIKDNFVKGNLFNILRDLLNSRPFLVYKTIGNICVLLIIFNLHIYCLKIVFIILILVITHLLFVLVNILIKLFIDIKEIFSINGVLNLIFSTIKLLSITILLYKIYMNNNEILVNINLYNNILITFLGLTILFLFVLAVIKLNLKLNNIITIFYYIFMVISVVIFNVFYLHGPIACQDNEDANKDATKNTNKLNTVDNSKTKEGGTHVHHHTHIHTEGAVTTITDGLKDSVKSVGSQAVAQVGLAGCITGGFTTGAMISAGQPPVTRLGITLACGAGGGAIHVAATAANKALAQANELKNKNNTPSDPDRAPSPGEGFVNSPNEEISIIDLLGDNSVELWLGCLLVMNIVNLFFLFFLFTTYISKIILSLNYELNWVTKILPSKIGSKTKSFLLTIIKILSKIRDFNIIMLIIVLSLNTIFIIYFSFLFYINLEDICNLYLELIKKK